MKNLMFLISILLCLILFSMVQSCSTKEPCDDTGVGRYYLSDELKKIPYTDSTILTFINTVTNDTHVFHTQSWIRSIGYAQLNSEHCFGDSIEGERRLDFVSSTFNKKIQIGISQLRNRHLLIYTLFICIDNKKFIFDDFWSPGRTSFPYTTPIQSYNNVYKLDDQDNMNSGNDSCYYNFQNGIIKIMTNTENLELVKVQ